MYHTQFLLSLLAQCIEVYNLIVILENIYRRICVFVCCGVIIIVQYYCATFNVISFFGFLVILNAVRKNIFVLICLDTGYVC